MMMKDIAGGRYVHVGITFFVAVDNIEDVTTTRLVVVRNQ